DPRALPRLEHDRPALRRTARPTRGARRRAARRLRPVDARPGPPCGGRQGEARHLGARWRLYPSHPATAVRDATRRRRGGAQGHPARQVENRGEETMPRLLTDAQVAHYRDQGFLFPVDVYTPAEADALYGKVASLEAEAGEELQKRYRVKAHLPFPFLCEVVRNERLLDAVEDVIGPNILCWGSSFFSKQARDPRYVSWHTD